MTEPSVTESNKNTNSVVRGPTTKAGLWCGMALIEIQSKQQQKNHIVGSLSYGHLAEGRARVPEQWADSQTNKWPNKLQAKKNNIG